MQQLSPLVTFPIFIIYPINGIKNPPVVVLVGINRFSSFD